MKKNMGVTDKVIRFLAAAIIISLYFTNVIEGTLAYVLMGLSVVFLVTSFISFCPLYSLVGLNTCKAKN
ncbi:DUF2892 domain-containing protein [Flavobacteriaceae bacterium R38]|nr:DUF2892 domain-containing protein [Flavobacteriaceae bacterium R38]